MTVSVMVLGFPVGIRLVTSAQFLQENPMHNVGLAAGCGVQKAETAPLHRPEAETCLEAGARRSHDHVERLPCVEIQ